MDRDGQDQNPTGSDSMSDLSQMSDFERQMHAEIRNKERERDERRLRNATTGSIKAFSKARPAPKLALTMNTLERHQDLSSDSGELIMDGERPTPVNIPETWGRKAKQNNNWLSRIQPDQEARSATSGALQTGKMLHDEALSPELDWMNVDAGDALPSVEDSSPLQNSKTKRQRSVRNHENTSIEEIMRLEQEEGEYSAESPVAQASERRRRLLSRRSYRTTETSRAVATKTERRPALPESPSRRSLRSILERDNIVNHIIEDHSINSGMSVNQKSPRSPLPALKSARTVGISNLEVEALAESSGNRAGPQRQDSRDLLRQLARASASPSSSFEKRTSLLWKSGSAKDKEYGDEQINEREGEKGQKAPSIAKSLPGHSVPQRDRPSTAPERRTTSSENASSHFDRADNLVVPDIHHRLPTPPDDNAQSASHGLVPKTPVVMGAWVHTPSTKKPKEENINGQTSAAEKEKKHVKPAPILGNAVQQDTSKLPVLPRSAAASIIDKTATISQDGNTNEITMGDSTLESIRNVAGQDVDYSTINLDVGVDLDDETLNMIENVNVPVTQAAWDRQLEAQTMLRMRRRLRAVRTGLRDASRGMKRVEREIENAEMANDKASASTSALQNGTATQQHLHQCTQCASGRPITLSSLIADAWHYFTSYFYTWPANRRWLPRLTWLGLALLLFTIWSISEVTLCEYYCHPLYAVYMEGYGVDINSPAMPWVTTTVLLARPTMWIWRPLLQAAGFEFEPGLDFPKWRKEAPPPPPPKRDWISELRASQGLHAKGYDNGVDWSMLDDERL